MKKILFPVLVAAITFSACKKSASSGAGASGTTATVTFTNNDLFDKRVILTGTGAADTLYPLPNRVVDIDVKAKSSVTRTDVPTGKRKLVVMTGCVAAQPVNLSCTGYVYRNAEYLAAKTYAEIVN